MSYFSYLDERGLLNGGSIPAMVNVSLFCWLLGGAGHGEVSTTEVFLPWWWALADVVRGAVFHELASSNISELCARLRFRTCLQLAPLFGAQLPEGKYSNSQYSEPDAEALAARPVASWRANALLGWSGLRPPQPEEGPGAEPSEQTTLGRCFERLEFGLMSPVVWACHEARALCRTHPDYPEVARVRNLHRVMSQACSGEFMRLLGRLDALPVEFEVAGQLREDAARGFSGGLLAEYTECLGTRKIRAAVMARQLLLGLPRRRDSAACLHLALRALRMLANVAILVTVAGLPCIERGSGRRGLDSSYEFALPEGVLGRCVAVTFMFWGCQMFAKLFWRMPYDMEASFRKQAVDSEALNAMLTGPDAAGAQLLPAVRVDVPDDLVAWVELRALLLAAAKRRKAGHEVSLLFNLVSVLGMLVLLAFHMLADGWKPGLLFYTTVLAVVCVVMNTVPALFHGLRVNLARRKTLDLLLGHVMECRVLAAYGRLGGTADPAGAERAAEVAQSLVLQLQLDASTLVNVLGMELTVRGFLSIASAVASAAAAISQKLNVGFMADRIKKHVF